MVSHTYSKNANVRANKKFYEKNREALQFESRKKYYNNPEARQKKLDKQKQRVYVEGTIKYIKLLFIE
jgi:hypothetical protein